MATVTTKDGTQIYYKDWGTGQPIVFSHGWPLTADDWDGQMLFFGQRGYRVIAHDRRGHGRSTQTWDGNDMDTYADDLAVLFEKLDLKDAIMVGHSTGGGEVARYLGRHGAKRVAKAALISAVPPLMLKTEKNPDGRAHRSLRRPSNSTRSQPAAILQGHHATRFTDTTARAQKFPRASASTGGCKGMMGGMKAHYDCIKAFSETDFTEDLKKIDIPVLVMHGDDDQIVPIVAAGPLSAKILKNCDAEGLSGLSARHASDQRGPDQRRFARFLQRAEDRRGRVRNRLSKMVARRRFLFERGFAAAAPRL